MTACPICATEATAKREGTPYWICPSCACWFQWPQPPKCYQDPAEPMVMNDHDKAVNHSLARHLVEHVMGGKPGRTLDVGAGWPYLAHCLAELGCDAGAIDGEPIPSPDLRVQAVKLDFEQWSGDSPANFQLVTCIHSFEHQYQPLAALRKLRRIVADDGRVFIRLPDHGVRGFERDLTAHHWLIHPYFHSLDSILEALQRTDTFTVMETSIIDGAGQRDILLRPIT